MQNRFHKHILFRTQDKIWYWPHLTIGRWRRQMYIFVCFKANARNSLFFILIKMVKKKWRKILSEGEIPYQTGPGGRGKKGIKMFYSTKAKYKRHSFFSFMHKIYFLNFSNLHHTHEETKSSWSCTNKNSRATKKKINIYLFEKQLPSTDQKDVWYIYVYLPLPFALSLPLLLSTFFSISFQFCSVFIFKAKKKSLSFCVWP